ncbi:MAG: glutathione S-transferase family protein [Pseudomonadota bacterium]
MKLYTCTGAPSPRRVTLYLQAKGIALEEVEINLAQGEHLQAEFLRKSPDGTVPVLELDNGRFLWDSIAIRRYLEDTHPEPAMMGTTTETRAEVVQWTNWVINHGLMAVAEAFRNRFPGFKDHALTGAHPIPQIEALAQRGLDRYPNFLKDLDSRLAAVPFVGGEQFSVADIDALVTIDFAARAIKIKPDDQHAAIQAWRQRITEFLG